MPLTNERYDKDGGFSASTGTIKLVFADPPHLFLPQGTYSGYTEEQKTELDTQRTWGYRRWWLAKTGMDITYDEAKAELARQDQDLNTTSRFWHVRIGIGPYDQGNNAGHLALAQVRDAMKLVALQAVITSLMADSEYYLHVVSSKKKGMAVWGFDVCGYERKTTDPKMAGSLHALAVAELNNANWV